MSMKAIPNRPGGLRRNPTHSPGTLYDKRLHELGLTFEDYRNAEQLGAVIQCKECPGIVSGDAYFHRLATNKP